MYKIKYIIVALLLLMSINTVSATTYYVFNGYSADNFTLTGAGTLDTSNHDFRINATAGSTIILSNSTINYSTILFDFTVVSASAQDFTGIAINANNSTDYHHIRYAQTSGTWQIFDFPTATLLNSSVYAIQTGTSYRGVVSRSPGQNTTFYLKYMNDTEILNISFNDSSKYSPSKYIGVRSAFLSNKNSAVDNIAYNIADYNFSDNASIVNPNYTDIFATTSSRVQDADGNWVYQVNQSTTAHSRYMNITYWNNAVFQTEFNYSTNNCSSCGYGIRFYKGEPDTNTNKYFYSLETSIPTQTLYINYRDNGTTTTLSQTNITITENNTYVLKVKVLNTKIFGKIWNKNDIEPQWNLNVDHSSTNKTGFFSVFIINASTNYTNISIVPSEEPGMNTYVINSSDLLDNGYNTSTNPTQSVYSRFIFTTNSTSINIHGTNSMYSVFPNLSNMAIRINNGTSTPLIFTSMGNSTFSQSLPPGTNYIEITTGAQSKPPSSIVLGNFINSIDYDFNASLSVVNVTPSRRVVIYGDSIHAGANANNSSINSLIPLLRSNYSISAMGEAWGYRTLYDDAFNPTNRTLFEQRIVSYNPRYFYLGIGTNDYALNKWSAVDFGNAYDSTITGISALNSSITIICQTPLTRANESANSFGNTLQDYRDQINTKCTSHSYPVIDGTAILNLTDLDDGVHPNTAGHAKYAAYIRTYFNVTFTSRINHYSYVLG